MNQKTLTTLYKNNFKLFLTIIVTATSLLILILLAYLSANDNLRVTSAYVARESISGIVAKENSFIFEFSRPLQTGQDKLEKFVTISPEIADFEASINRDELIISTKSPLQKNTEYQVQIQPGILDIYGHTTKSEKRFKFHTQKPELLYMKKETLYLSDLGGHELKIYSDEYIAKYQASSDGKFVFILLKNVSETELLRFDRATSEVSEIKELSKYNIETFEIDDSDNLWVIFSEVANFDKKLGVISNINSGNPQQYTDLIVLEDLSKITRTAYNLDILDEETLIIQSHEGLIQTDLTGGILSPIKGFKQPHIINKQDSRTFNYRNNFDESTPNAQIFLIDNNDESLVVETKRPIGNMLSSPQNLLIWSEEDRILGTLVSFLEVKIFAIDQEKIIKVFNDESFSYELPSIDLNGQLLAIEKIPREAIENYDYDYRVAGDSARPKDSDLIIINLQDNFQEVIRVENAYLPIWIN